MAFHDLETLSAAAVQAAANSREQDLQHSLFPALLGQPWPENCLPSVPPGGDGAAHAPGVSGAAPGCGEGEAWSWIAPPADVRRDLNVLEASSETP